MRPADCILVRVGEQALKSEQVQRRWQGILIDNIKSALKSADIVNNIETNPNRIFIYTQDLEKASEVLKHIFGITSISLVWTCFSGLDEIKLLATDIAVEVLKLSPEKSFAIRAHRSGHHKFSSQTIAEEAGAAVKRVTNAKVNLGKPDYEIEIECRSRKTYIFTERIRCAGGLPVGSGGKAIALVSNERDVIAAWLIMKRGISLAVIGKGKFLPALQKWNSGRELHTVDAKKASKYIKEKKINAIVCSGKMSAALKKVVKQQEMLVLNPLTALTGQELGALRSKFMLTGQ